jgi:DNA modification methylase
MKREQLSDNVTLYLGDCRDVLPTLPENSIDAIVTDPPYGLGFMGKAWDKGVPDAALFAAALRVLKPGGHMLCFAGTRTHHRMASRIEDAGFEIRDMIAWVYGSGFPKSHDVSKAIDRGAGAEREVVGPDKYAGRRTEGSGPANGDACYGQFGIPGGITATEAACAWSGWGTALKPALEPITVCRKPFPGTVAANVQQHGTGALNIDACRVAANGETPSGSGRKSKNTWDLHSGSPFQGHPNVTPPSGRWPANLIHDGSDEVLVCFPQTDGRNPKGVKINSKTASGTNISKNCYGGFTESQTVGYSDTGSAARFFYCPKASKADRDEGVAGVAGVAGVGALRDGGRKSDPRGNTHPTVKPVDLMRYLCRLVTPPGGIVLDPFAGSGSTGKGAIREGFGCILIERDAETVTTARARLLHEINKRPGETK